MGLYLIPLNIENSHDGNAIYPCLPYIGEWQGSGQTCANINPTNDFRDYLDMSKTVNFTGNL